MAAHKYKARVVVEGGTEEVQFERLDADAPRIQARYRHDEKEFGKFKDGHTYRLNPERLEDEAVEEQAELEIEQAQAEATAMKKGPKKGSKK